MSKAWKVLGRLAASRVQERNQELRNVISAITQLEQRRAQIMFLIAENQTRLQNKKLGCSMSEFQVISRFITNLGAALRGTEVEMHALEVKRSSVFQQLNEAKREEQKMDSLLERDEARSQRTREIREQKAIDSAAISAFNRK